MKKTLLIISCISAGIIFLLILAITMFATGVLNYEGALKFLLKDSLDYKKNLAVESKSKYKKNPAVESKSKPAEDKKPNQAVDQRRQEEADASLLDESYIINVLFLGIDRTEERDRTIGIYRTDTISLARINMNTKKVKILCIPRDTYTYIPIEKKKDKINHAYAYGSLKKKGEKSSVNAVNSFLKKSVVDYYISIEMEPVPDIVDDLGGVELDVEINMETHGWNISKGRQILDGENAYRYITWRYSGMGDIDRIKRQQKFSKAVFKKIKDSGNILEVITIILKYNKYIKSNMTTGQLISFGKLCAEIPEKNISYDIIPGNCKTINKISYYIPDKDETAKLIKEFLSED